jgi:hypothetical protein
MRETGMGITNPLWFVGVVENNVDERLEGRVQVRAFNIHGTVDQIPSENLPWAIPISGNYNPNNPPPPLNSWVFGFFIDGRDAQQPMIIGLIPTQMTEAVNPRVTGWGRIPNSAPSDYDRLAPGSRARDFGQPQMSRLARGENIEETYVVAQEANRIRNIQSTPGQPRWEEPGAAYAAQYPFNRVIETSSGHSIEIDDTPGAERIMVHHKSGSFVQIDSRGTRVDKTVSDNYEINQINSHVYVGGRSVVTIEGDSHVVVKGNKTEEIFGNYRQLIHGNHEISVAGQMNLNASDEIQARAAKIRIQSNVSGIDVKSAKTIKLESGESTHLKSEDSIFINSKNSTNMKSDVSISIQSTEALNVKAKIIKQESSEGFDIKGENVKIGGGSKVSINASLVALDDIIQLANSQSDVPEESADAQPAETAQASDMPEPVEKSIPSTNGGIGTYRNLSSIGSTGLVSSDDTDSGAGTGQAVQGTQTSENTPESLRPLLNLIAQVESQGSGGYNAYNRGTIGNRVLSANERIDFSNMRISELQRRQSLPIENPERIFAAGRYQIIPSTLNETLRRTGITPDQFFSPDVQDRLAIQLLIGAGLNRYRSNAISAETFGNNIARIWAGLPVVTGPRAGFSFYGGANRAGVSVASVTNAIASIRNSDFTTQTA